MVRGRSVASKRHTSRVCGGPHPARAGGGPANGVANPPWTEGVHSIQRAVEVSSVDAIIRAAELRPRIIEARLR